MKTLIHSKLDHEVRYGVLEVSCLTLSHLTIIGKYFLYVCALNGNRYHFADFIALVQEKIELKNIYSDIVEQTMFFWQEVVTLACLWLMYTYVNILVCLYNN